MKIIRTMLHDASWADARRIAKGNFVITIITTGVLSAPGGLLWRCLVIWMAVGLSSVWSAGVTEQGAK